VAEFEETLRTAVLGDATVTTLFGERWYAGRLPDAVTLPAIRYATISRTAEYSQSGPSGLANPRAQIDVYAATYTAAKAGAAAVRDAIHAAVGGDLQALFVEDERDVFEDEVSGSGGEVHRVMLQLRAWAAVA
jgi:hypothetical protein